MSSVAVTGRQTQMVAIEQVIYPACVCGAPWPAHGASAICQGYVPRRPVESLGVVSYTHRKRICRVLYALERWARRSRESFERRPHHG